MTTQHQLNIDLVREAAINANLKINDRLRIYGTPPTIRLADVLLVLSAPKMFEDLAHYEWVLYGLCSGGFPKSWNLRADDLTLQTPECVAFIRQILCL